MVTGALDYVHSILPSKKISILNLDSTNLINYPIWMDTFIEPNKNVNPSNVYTFECEFVVQKPKEFTTACADFGEMIYQIQWSTWSAQGSMGSGIYSIKTCEPDCASGIRYETPVNLWLKNTSTDGRNFFLNTLFVFPAETHIRTKTVTKNKPFKFEQQFSINSKIYTGAIWDVSSDWKIFSELRSSLP